MAFMKTLKLCERHGFIRPIFNAMKIVSPESAERSLTIGPVGALLAENLKAEWRNGVVNNKDVPVFYSVDNFVDSYAFAREMCSEWLNFGVADVVQIRNRTAVIPERIIDEPPEESKIRQKKKWNLTDEKVVDFFEYFKDYHYLRSSIFIPPSESMRFFHEWQRQRRVWWRKFSSTPGRYYTTDIQTGKDGMQLVEIRARYPFGIQTVESLMLYEKHPLLDEDQLRNKQVLKRVQSSCVISIVPLSTMFLNTICDSFEELPFMDNQRTFLRLHRKLAPYKISIALPNCVSGVLGDELKDLATYICRKFRALNMTTLLLPSSSRSTVEQQLIQYDSLGVPYTVIINENTLKNGIVHLRNRDTTLKEDVHINELPSYMELLLKNY